MKSPKRPATPVSPPDDPVKRRLLKKTDMKSDDVLMSVEIEDTDPVHTVNALVNDETGKEAQSQESYELRGTSPEDTTKRRRTEIQSPLQLQPAEGRSGSSSPWFA